MSKTAKRLVGYRKMAVALYISVIGSVAAFLLPRWESWEWLRPHTTEIWKWTVVCALGFLGVNAGINMLGRGADALREYVAKRNGNGYAPDGAIDSDETP